MNTKRLLNWSAPIMGMNNLGFASAMAQPARYHDGGMGSWMMGNWGMGWFGMIVMLLFWGLIIAALVLLIRWLIQNTGDKGRSSLEENSRALNILKERYARGEISRAEFEAMKKDLRQ